MPSTITEAHDSGGKPVTIVVVGAGHRGLTYAGYALRYPELAKVVGVAEPIKRRRRVLSEIHSIPEENQFGTWKDLAAKGRIADAVIIGVLDHLHAEAVADFAKLGYHILCEKPMATTIADCLKMIKDVNASPNNPVFGIGHVLRYSPYNTAVKEVIDSGALGEIINIQHIEPVGNQHFAHSFVRGNWHKEADCSFALMTKCCHDIDILSFYLSGLRPKKVSSFGSIGHFKKSRKPAEAGSATKCLSCPTEPDCVWSAKKVYVDPLSDKNSKRNWASLFVDADVLDIENVTEALNTTAYGNCVYECDNDVVDHQVVNIEYEGGVTASMTMSAFTESECNRGTRIHGTKGELIGDMVSFTVFDFLTRTKTTHSPALDGGSHGGGDMGLARAFVASVASNDQAELGVTPGEILNSHLLVFAAETARREGRVVDFDEFEKGYEALPESK
ncbi:related to dehydrogenases and related proteins [Cephalotrichum gorgonifer]|uniref:Related to dehydrogenases and related proteins n=1 Tax=Cephalotrichum gorgonifer TaxID=2041049 RepID=A0AAE8SU91_9PEZI|nr:related to dehydrogenases and related proteins [Cephalotrichum gorgonifer]